MVAPEAVDGLERQIVEVAGRGVPVYRSTGGGPVELVALHGGFTDPLLDFGRLLPHLDPRLSLILPVLQGHQGRRVDPGEAIGPASAARDVRALADAMRLRRPVLGGFSLGARAAMLAAALGVSTPALVLVGPRFAGFEAGEFRALVQQAAKRRPEWAGEERRTVVDAMAAGIVDFEIEAETWAAEVAGLPVLALRGGDDRVSSADELARFRTLPVDARVESVPGHGHRVQHTAPTVVAALINDFLSEIGVFA